MTAPLRRLVGRCGPLEKVAVRVSPSATRIVKYVAFNEPPHPPFVFGRPRWGNLRRTKPFSPLFGSDRGTPLDRSYVAAFLEAHASDIHGEVLEVGSNRYARSFGGPRVTGTHVLDSDPANRQATVIADLSEPDSLPAGRFHCFLLLQTLQFVPDAGIAVENAWRALAPGGTLLMSVPTVSRVDPAARATDRWRFTPAGLEQLVTRSCPEAQIEVNGYGNVLTATAFVMGLSAQELTDSELGFVDPDFPLLACARVSKAGT